MNYESAIKSEVYKFINQINPRKTGIYLPKNIETCLFERKSLTIANVGCKNNNFTVNFNLKYLEKYYDRIVSEIIPHEIAHVATIYMYDENANHNWLWKELCLKLGGNGEEFFKL